MNPEVIPGVMSMLMFTSKSWTEKRSVVVEDSSVLETSAGLASVVGLAGTDGNDAAPAAVAATR